MILSLNKKDDIWLGQGMYFWDNIGNVNWWKKKQERRNPDKEFVIAAANANLEKILDLTDYDIYMKLEELWKAACKKARRAVDVPLGNKLDFLFDVEQFDFIYSIIKVYGKYNLTPDCGVFKFNYRSVTAEPTIGVKCIYSIRNSDCIIEKEYVS